MTRLSTPHGERHCQAQPRGSLVLAVLAAERGVDSGASVVIIATADAGYAVSNWTGCDSVVDNQCTVVMNTSKVLSATITPIQYSLTVMQLAMCQDQ